MIRNSFSDARNDSFRELYNGALKNIRNKIQCLTEETQSGTMPIYYEST